MTASASRLTKRAKTQGLSPPEARTNPAPTVRVFVDGLGRLGYETAPLLEEAGLRLSDLDSPDGQVPCTATEALFCAAMQQRPMKNLAMHLAAATPMGAFPLIDYLVITSESVGAGLKQLARYLRLADAPYQLDFRETEDPIRVVFENQGSAFAVEFGVTLTVLHLREETENRLCTPYVNFRHHPEDVAEFERVLGCPVRVNGSWDGFALSEKAWQHTLRRRDPILRAVLEQQAAELISRLPAVDDIVLGVRRTLAARIAKGDVQIGSVARVLATSPRSLQRRLAAAGSTYQELLELTRRDAAQKYLSVPTLSIGEVAYLLGYSEPAAFHRAFKRWNGVGPKSFRESLSFQGRAPRRVPT